MLDLRLIRENPSLVAHELGRRGLQVDLGLLQNTAKQQKDLEKERSLLQAESNQIGKEVGLKIQNGCNPKSMEINDLRAKGNKIKRQVSSIDRQEKELAKKIKEQILILPNLPSKLCPEGNGEEDNREISRWGIPKQEEGLLNHWEIADHLGIIDTERSSRIAQSRFVTLINQGARLERSLINFMLDSHTTKGYVEVLPPVLVNTDSLKGSGQLPKFAEESFKCAEDDLWLTPTAEVP